MSVRNFIPFVWRQTLEDAINQKCVIASQVRNIGGEDIKQWGDEVIITENDEIRVKAYSPDEKECHPDVLAIDHGAYFNFFVFDADRAQSSLSAMNDVVANAAEKIASNSEQYLVQKACEKAGTRMKMKRPKNADEFCGMLVEVFAKTVGKVGKCIDVSVCVPDDLVSIMAGDPRLEYRLVGNEIRVYCDGIQIFITPYLENAILTMDNTDVAFAGRVTRIEAYRPERGFCDGVKGLYLCGVKVIEPNHIVVCEFV